MKVRSSLSSLAPGGATASESPGKGGVKLARKAGKQAVLVLHGPNLNALGKRDHAIYGKKTLAEINEQIEERARSLGLEVSIYQSNS
ncbi:MAG: type II 3-dehydroquinate dehydratase, partial [Chloroflexi bacterium]|nr:type II 3-dehydroquinate dehydratase [Chloroflexota bacterium]